MKIAVEVAPVTSWRVATALTLGAGVLAMVSWYQAWFTLHFPTGNLAESPYITGNLAESPYLVAEDPSGSVAWLVLGVGIAFTLLGVIMIIWHQPLLAIAQTAITAGLLIAIYPLLGEMGVFTSIAGYTSQGVTLLPEWGIYLIVLSFVLSVVAAILLWREMRSARS